MTSLLIVHSLSHVQLFVTGWTAARQASLSITSSQSLLKLMSTESVMHPTISSSVIPFSSCLQSFPASGSFLMSQLFTSGGQHGFNPWVRKIPWGRKWQPATVFCPGKSHGQRSLAGYSPWGDKELDTPEWLNTAQHLGLHSYPGLEAWTEVFQKHHISQGI